MRGYISMSLSEPWEILGGIAIAVAVLASVLYQIFVWYVLERWGKSTRGVVVRSVEQNADGSMVFVVSYEFTTPDRQGEPVMHAGKQTTRYGFGPRDIVAVRYWPRWPVISRIVERAV
jgi:hypothetical protein